MRHLLLIVFTASIAIQPPAEARQIISADLYLDTVAEMVRLPTEPHCAMNWAVARLEFQTQVPISAETIPGECWGQQPSTEGAVVLKNITVRGALDRLIMLDPRYAWRVVDGVIIVRPQSAWDDPLHLLNRAMSPFQTTDTRLGPTLDEIQNAIGLNPILRHEDVPIYRRDLPHFVVNFPGGTWFEALNAIVREHKDLSWHVSYCGPEQTVDNMIVAIASRDDRNTRLYTALLKPGSRPSPCAKSHD